MNEGDHDLKEQVLERCNHRMDLQHRERTSDYPRDRRQGTSQVTTRGVDHDGSSRTLRGNGKR
jgi:hypothetical protein